MRDFRNLEVWKKSFDFAEKVYDTTKGFPIKEDYVLTSQLRRVSVGVFSNIAEGCGRDIDKDTIRFMYNAMGSIREVEAQLLFAEKVDYLGKELVEDSIAEAIETGKMLLGYIKYLIKSGREGGR